MNATELLPGFADPVHESHRIFRAVLDAMSRPGSIQHVPDMALPPPLMPASAAILLALADFETPIWLDDAELTLRDFLRFHAGSPIVDEPGRASFALVTDPKRMPTLDVFAQGTDEFPDRSTTLIVQVRSLEGAQRLRLTGPGINGSAEIAPEGLPARFADWMQANHAGFPKGVDLILANGRSITALPRSTLVET